MILEAAFTLLMLILIQAVLGFDNLLYISLESQRAPAKDQARVRTIGIAIAVVLRIVLLMVIVWLYSWFKEWEVGVNLAPVVTGKLYFASIVEIVGGAFILYTAVKEIFHMLTHIDLGDEHRTPTSPGKIIALIVFMNLVFSFDSILAAIQIVRPAKDADHHGEDHAEPVAGAIENAAAVVEGGADLGALEVGLMATAIIIGGILMIALATKVTQFLEKNRMYQVLGLFILFLVGIMLISQGGSHLQLFGKPIEAMSKATFYFVLFTLIVIDLVQSKYQKNILAAQRIKQKGKSGHV